MLPKSQIQIVVKIVMYAVIVLIASAWRQAPIDQLRQHWNYDARAPLNIRQTGVQIRDGVKIYDITYASPVGDRSAYVGPNGGAVTSYLVVPPGSGRFPAVIYGHWCMPGSDKENRNEFLDEAVVLAHSGVVSLLPDHVIVHPGFVVDSSPLNEQQGAVEVQQDINLRRGADLLLARKDVDPNRLAYVGHSCDASAGGYLSGVDKRFKAFVIMAGELSFAVDERLHSKAFAQYQQRVGAQKLDDFIAGHLWLDGKDYISHAAPATVFLQYASQEDYLNPDLARAYFAIVSEPKKMKIYDAPHALNARATRDRIAFLAEQLSFKMPSERAVNSIPPLVQPPEPKSP